MGVVPWSQTMNTKAFKSNIDIQLSTLQCVNLSYQMHVKRLRVSSLHLCGLLKSECCPGKSTGKWKEAILDSTDYGQQWPPCCFASGCGHCGQAHLWAEQCVSSGDDNTHGIIEPFLVRARSWPQTYCFWGLWETESQLQEVKKVHSSSKNGVNSSSWRLKEI